MKKKDFTLKKIATNKSWLLDDVCVWLARCKVEPWFKEKQDWTGH